jgi:hypothetical protein
MPAVPLLLVSLAVGAHALGRRRRGAGAHGPLLALLVLALLGAARTAGPVSRHLHNDGRNINEVQRARGDWRGASLPPGARIASSDAGAIRYASGLPTLDVLGLNTPRMLSPDEAYLRANPVVAVVLLPAWFQPVDAAAVRVVHGAETADYTVTSNPRMGRQIVLAAAGDAPVVARFVGYRSFDVVLLPLPGS